MGKYELECKIKELINTGHEGDYWDFKQEWASSLDDIVKDIICFSNTVHDLNCYIIIGVNDKCEVVGMKEPRRKQADLLDAVSYYHFAGENVPIFSVETIKLNRCDIDIITIYNTLTTPVYLRKNQGKLIRGIIYSRTGDKNTPFDSIANATVVEDLWKKRFGLLKPKLEYLIDSLKEKDHWTRVEDIFHNCYKPEFTIEIKSNDDDSRVDKREFYSYAMANESTDFGMIALKHSSTTLIEIPIVFLDGYRFLTPCPEWGTMRQNGRIHFEHLAYKYFVVNSIRYKLHHFLYDDNSGDQRIARNNLLEVALIFKSEDERIEFEHYVESNYHDIQAEIATSDRYKYLEDSQDKMHKKYVIGLRTGEVLKRQLKQMRILNGYEDDADDFLI